MRVFGYSERERSYGKEKMRLHLLSASHSYYTWSNQEAYKFIEYSCLKTTA